MTADHIAMRLLITRPRDDAAILAERLAALGHQTLIEPMLTIARLPVTFPHSPIAAIVLTSRHAARMMEGHVRGLPLENIPIFCVGAATAEAARKAGMSNVVEGSSDARALAAMAIASLAPGTDAGIVLHVRGHHARGDIAGELRRHGIDAREIIAYEAIAAQDLSQATRNAITTGALDGALFLSPRTAKIFARLALDAGLGPALKGTTAYCLSDAVATELAGLPMQTTVAPEPRLSALLELLNLPDTARS
ncbi:MAG: uroporphyrinogen-III synthase [Rhizobiales bacterium]|nr:uroporphyrinogen-III synthase [Hyphomicrobiales bacterium]